MGSQGNAVLHVVMATGKHPELSPTCVLGCRKQDEFDKGSVEVRSK